MRQAALIALVVAFWQAAPIWAAGKPTLSKKELHAAEFVTEAYFRGDARSAVQILSPLLGKLTDERLELFDHALSDKGLPPLASILSDARLAMAQQGFDRDLPKLQVRELLLILPVLQDQVSEYLAAEQASDAMPPPGGASLEQYETLFWNIHVQINRLGAGKRLAEYTSMLAASVPRRQRARLGEDDLATLDRDYAGDVKKFDQAVAELAERELEHRLVRLGMAKAVLEKPDLSKERFHAAYAWKRDSNQILLALENRKRDAGGEFSKPELNSPELAGQVEEDADRCRELAGDLTTKATWLAEGLHWWLRGRYGAGPDVWGLAKSQTALQSPAAMFPLLMPARLPTPTGSMIERAKSGPTYYDRRHHYWWAWEDRRVQASRSSNSQTGSNFQDWCKNGYFW